MLGDGGPAAEEVDVGGGGEGVVVVESEGSLGE